MIKQRKRSPFPRPSLPQAGESLGFQAFDVFIDVFTPFMMGLALAIVALMEWATRWLGQPMSPRIWTVLAIGFLGWSG